MPMKKILLLKLENEQSPKPIKGLNKFNEIANQHGLELKTLNFRHLNQNKIDESHLYAQIQEAHGFLINSTNLLSDANIRNAINARLKEGAIAFADIPGPTEQQKDGDLFFQELGLEPTSIRACARKHSKVITEGDHPSLIEFNRHGFEYGFRDANLFEGVSTLLLQQPNGLGCLGNTKPILSLPLSEISLLETRRDVYVDGLNRPEFPLMGVVAKDDWKGKVIATTAGFIHDSYPNMFGYIFPGIEGGNNIQLTQNLIRIISEGFPLPGRTWQSIYILFSEIELRCLEITRSLLSNKFGNNWFDLSCPAVIKEKCLARASYELPGVPLYIFLDLIDFKNIWKENWSHFSVFFATASLPNPSKNSALKFFQELNEIRKVVAHPIRQLHPRSASPSNEQFTLIKQTLEKLKTLKI
jgi:hypothetical protein